MFVRKQSKNDGCLPMFDEAEDRHFASDSVPSVLSPHGV